MRAASQEPARKLPLLTAAASQAAARLLASETILATIDTFATALTTVATSSRRSPLATAALREFLHPADTDPSVSADGTSATGLPYFSHVLIAWRSERRRAFAVHSAGYALPG